MLLAVKQTVLSDPLKRLIFDIFPAPNFTLVELHTP